MAHGFVSFSVNRRRYRIAATEVEELMPATAAVVRRVPGSPSGVRGLFAVGDAAVPLIDLGILFGTGPTILGASSCILVCRAHQEGATGQDRVGLAAEAVPAVEEKPGSTETEGDTPCGDDTDLSIECVLSRVVHGGAR